MPIDGDIVLKAGLDASGVSDKLKGLQKSVSKGFKNLIRVGFGVRSIFALIRRMRKALFEGFENLAQVHEPFNQAMSQIMTSLDLLKNTFAAAFAPIIEVVAPILSRFINMIANAVSAVGQFIAALTGKEYVAAAAVQVDYAASLDKSTASSKKATSATNKQQKAAEKLQRTLAKFDDVNILKQDDDKDTDTETSAPATSPAVAFKNAPIGNAVSKFAEEFKAAWANADFTDLGAKLGKKLKDMLDNIPWNDIKKQCNKIAKSIATFINGYVEVPGLWKSVGTTIGEAINTAVGAAGTYIRTLHWTSIGNATRDMIVYALRTINWDLVNQTVKDFATGLANYLNALFKPDTFAAIGDTVAELLNTALDGLNTFGQKFNFKGFGESLATGINKFLAKFNPLKLAKGVRIFVEGFRDAVVSWLKLTNWTEFGTKLREAIVNIPWKIVLLGFGSVFWNAINAVIKFFKGLFDTDNIESPFTDVLNSIEDTVNGIAESIDFDAIAKGIGSIVDALEPVGEGFGKGFAEFFAVLKEIGIIFFTLLGPTLEAIGNGISKIPPEILEGIGKALGIIVGYLLTVKAFGLLALLVEKLPLIGTALTTIGTAAPTAAAGIGSFVAAAFPAALALGAFAATLELTKEKIVDTREELKPLNDTHADTLDIVEKVGKQFGLTEQQISETAWQIHNALDPHTKDANRAFAQLDENLRNSGVDIDAFHIALGEAASKAERGGKDISDVAAYIDRVGTSSEESSVKTDSVSSALESLNDMSWSTPLKLALIKAAIDGLGKSGKLSDDDIQKIHKTLDEYDPSKPEESMGKIGKAFDDARVSGTDFSKAIPSGLDSVKTEIPKKEKPIIDQIQQFGLDLGKEGKKGGNNLGTGLVEGIDEKQQAVKKSSSTLVGFGIDGMVAAGDMHSPSRKTRTLGKNLGEGLRLGLNDTKSNIRTAAEQLITVVKNAFSKDTDRFTSYGKSIVSKLKQGLSNNSETLKTAATNAANTMYNEFTAFSWYNVGYNIAQGIYNGLVNQADWLNTLAWNTAVNMYNSSARALGIASPSKKFAWIGKMVAQGLGNGILDNQDNAVSAVTDVTDAMTKEAQGATATFSMKSSIDSWIDDLDVVLTAFSNHIIERFDTLTTAMSNLINVPTYGLSAVAQGRVIPSSINASANNATDMSSIMGMLGNIATNKFTLDELRQLMIEMFTDYMNMAWYVGDEQLARHVNNGNLLIDRRYSTIVRG